MSKIKNIISHDESEDENVIVNSSPKKVIKKIIVRKVITKKTPNQDNSEQINGGVILQGIDKAFVDVQYYKKNGLTTIDVFRNQTGYNDYYKKGKTNNANTLTRKSTKILLRKYLYEYKEQFKNSTIVISYLTDDGVKYVDLDNTRDMGDDVIENVLMLDPVNSEHYENNGNSTIMNRTIYGMKLLVLKHPDKPKFTKKVKPKLQFNGAPKLKVV